MNAVKKRKAVRWFTGFFIIIFLAALYGCGEGLPKDIKLKAKAIPDALESAQTNLKQQKAKFEDLKKQKEFDPVKRFSQKENWSNRFDQARRKIQAARTGYEKELLPLIKKDNPESIALIQKHIYRINKAVSKSKTLAGFPLQRFAAIRNTIANTGRLVPQARQKTDQIEHTINRAKEDIFDKALVDFPDSTPGIEKRFEPLKKILNQSQSSLEKINAVYEAHTSGHQADYAVLTDNLQIVDDLLNQTNTSTANAEKEIKQLYQSYTKILKDMKVSYFVTIKRESWDDNSDYYNPYYVTFTREVSPEVYDVITADNIDSIADITAGWGGSRLRNNIGSAWKSLNINPTENWPSRSHNAASFWVETSQEKYYHKYVLENDGKMTKTQWEPVSEKTYESNIEYLGMAIVSKPYGTFEKDSMTQAAPPGMAYVGNRKYGEWKTDNNGDRFWSWYGKWAFFSNLFFFPPYHYRYNSWYGWRNNYRYKKPYFGKTNKGFQQFGTHGTFVKKSPNFMNTTFAKSGGFRSQASSVRGAGPGLRGGGPKNKGK